MPGMHATPDDVSALEHAVDLRLAAIERRLTALEATPAPTPPPVTPPAVDDPQYSGDVQTLPQIAAGSTLDLGGRCYRVTQPLPGGITILNGELIIPDGLAWGMQGTTLRGLTLTGMKPRQQFKRVRESLAAEFGADTITLALGSQSQRSVTSALIPLDPTKRYGVWIDDGFARGNGAAPMIWVRCAADGSEIGAWNPQTPTADQWNALRGCAGLKVRLNAARPAGVTGDLSPVYDVTKIKIFEAVNDLATLPITPYENATSLYVGAGSSLTDVLIRDMRLSAAKIVQATNAVMSRVRVRHCIGGLSSQQSTGSKFLGCDIDLHALDDRGALVPSGLIYRNHGINIAIDQGCTVQGGRVVGASWAIENAENASHSADTVVDNVEALGVHNCVSNNATRGKTINCRSLRLSVLGYIGVEANLTDSLIENCTITQDTPAMQSHGIASATVLTRAVVRNNTIKAGIGIQFYAASPAPDRQIVVEGNQIHYSVCAVAWNVQGLRVRDNRGVRTGHYAQRGTEAQQALLQYGTAPLAEDTGNALGHD